MSNFKRFFIVVEIGGKFKFVYVFTLLKKALCIIVDLV